MKLSYNKRFFDELQEIIDFIKLDSKQRAMQFQADIFNKCNALKSQPLIYRKSHKVNEANARDLIYKGYVIPYLINEQNIVILGIYKANVWE